MEVKIKSFDVEMEVKKNGIEFEVRSPDGTKHMGDLHLSMARLVWCQGKKGLKNGQEILWTDFVDLMKLVQEKKKVDSKVSWRKVIKLLSNEL